MRKGLAMVMMVTISTAIMALDTSPVGTWEYLAPDAPL
jgi:hypothetical protein